MKIVCISDVHEQEQNITLPEGDVLICAGDITLKGSLMALNKFCAWMKEQNFRHKILIFGNHELGFEYGPKREEALNTVKVFGITYLENSGVNIEGLEIWGSPITPYFHGWAWNKQRGEQIARFWEQIPENTNILITHGPPARILDLVPGDGIFTNDEHTGCEDLLKRIENLPNLKAHIFGHIHSGHGTFTNEKGVQFINAAICGHANDKRIAVNQPIVIEI